jgi:hypothetical protein
MYKRAQGVVSKGMVKAKKNLPCLVADQALGLAYVRYLHPAKPGKGLDRIIKIIHDPFQIGGYCGVTADPSEDDITFSKQDLGSYISKRKKAKAKGVCVVKNPLCKEASSTTKELSEALRYLANEDTYWFRMDSGYKEKDDFDVAHVGEKQFADIAQDFVDINDGCTFELGKLTSKESRTNTGTWIFLDNTIRDSFRMLHRRVANFEMQTKEKNANTKHPDDLKLKNCKVKRYYKYKKPVRYARSFFDIKEERKLNL